MLSELILLIRHKHVNVNFARHALESAPSAQSDIVKSRGKTQFGSLRGTRVLLALQIRKPSQSQPRRNIVVRHIQEPEKYCKP